ncbi:MAG TPA: ABC transporter substrate-binding protein [Cyclobacteriaceae bacterium]|jgi:iron complex transport system substrate-binding protein
MKNGMLCLILSMLFCCSEGKRSHNAYELDTAMVPLRYAEGFSIKKVGKATQVTVHYPYQGATSGHTYLLVKDESDVSDVPAGTSVITIPIKSIVCTSTTHIPMLDYLGETSKLTGFPTLDYVSSSAMRARIDSGKVQELGVDKSINLEVLAALRPDMVMGYSLTGDYGQFRKMEELGIPVVLNAEYLEKHPLGRAEWIKFVALFFDKLEKADSIFSSIEKSYNETRALAAQVTERPTVLSGIVYGDAWFLPGGQNYAAQLFKDAGCQYLWADDESNGFLQLAFEAVYAKAHAADLWIGVASFGSLNEMQKADKRYAGFDAFKKGEVYNYNARLGAKGGNEYLELGYLRPDIILKDLVKIAHPQLLPDYRLYFHKKLE